MKRFNKLIWFLLLIISPALWAQQPLSLSKAIETALEHNYGIRLVNQEKELASNNASWGNAGFLPRVGIQGSQAFSVTDSRQEFLSGQVNDRSGAKADNLNAGLQLNWTIFDGFRMFRRLDQLRELEAKSELQLLLTVESTINNVHQLYYRIVQLQQQQNAIKKSLSISRERHLLALHKLETGAGSRLEVLQAEVDMNADSAALMNVIFQQTQSKISLNMVLGQKHNESYLINDTILLMPMLDEEWLATNMQNRNTTINLSRSDEKLAELALREIKGRKLPELGLNAGYSFIHQQSESGFLIQNRSLGMTYGISANLNIFNGLNTRREQQNLVIQRETQRIRQEALVSELRGSLHANYAAYQNKLLQLQLEYQNMDAAYNQLDIAKERYLIGDLSGLEFREAQRNYLNAETRLNNLLFDAKVIETALLQIAGLLVLR